MTDPLPEVDSLYDVRSQLVLALKRVENSRILPPNVQDALIQANEGKIEQMDLLISALKTRPTEQVLYVVRNFLNQWRMEEIDARMYGNPEAIPNIDIPEV